MVNLREIAESDLAKTLEGDFGQTTYLTAPDGSTFEAKGRIDYNTQDFDPDTGAPILVQASSVTYRKSTLAQVPAAGENWFIKIPESPVAGASLLNRAMSKTRAPANGDSIGFIRIFLQEADQST
jgi:hypothetical protein